MNDLRPVLAAMRLAARQAGEVALKHFRPGQQTSAAVHYKESGSPVSAADLAANEAIRKTLAAAFPEIAWFSEETADTPERLKASRLFIVDPIDGTRAYCEGNPEWAISIALVESGLPMAAVLDAPALGAGWHAMRGGGVSLDDAKGAFRGDADAGIKLGGPKPVLDRIAAEFGRAGTATRRMPRIPSLALRLASVASGRLDIAVASKDAKDWDIAAADLILAESGHSLTGFGGARPIYNRPDPVHPPLVAASAGLLKRLRAIEF